METQEYNEHSEREYNLNIKNDCISPCTISFVYQADNRISWNGKELEKQSQYWYSIKNIQKNIGDRIEVYSLDKRNSEVIKVTTLELVEMGKGYLTLLSLNQAHVRRDKQKFCPTCRREYE